MSLSIEPNPRVTFAVHYEDAALAIIEKPTRVPTQPGRGHQTDTLLNGLFARWGNQLQNLGKSRDFGLLHRLDRETSGLLVVALRPAAYDKLRDDFAARKVRKFYWAVCAKPPRKPMGVIRMPIIETPGVGKASGMKLARITRAGAGKPAVTAYRVLEANEHAVLIEARPVTGRLHQVRLHLNAIGCPILGDTIYGPRGVHGAAPRLALHAHRLALTHPATGETIDVHTDWPKDLRKLLKQVRLGAVAPAAKAAESVDHDDPADDEPQ